MQTVIITRPPGWEYLLLAGGIWRHVHDHEEKALDHELGFAPAGDAYVAALDIPSFTIRQLDELKGLIAKLSRMIADPAQVWALGEPGTAGDPARIVHLCGRFAATYEEILNWAARIRGTATPEQFQELLFLLSRFADQPVRSIRVFADDLVSEVERIPAYLAADDPAPLGIGITLKIGFDRDVMEKYEVEQARCLNHR